MRAVAIVGAILALGTAGLSGPQALASPIPPIDFDGSNYAVASCDISNGCATGSGGIASTNGTASAGSSLVTWQAILAPVPSVFATATAILPPIGGTSADANVIYELNYSMYVGGPIPSLGSQITANLQASGITTGNAGDTFTVSNGGVPLVTGTNTFSLNIPDLQLTVGNFYLISMLVNPHAISNPTNGGGQVDATAEIDPLFTLDQSLLNQGFFLQFSDGIGNGAQAATPLPATLPLFAGGLGALGLLGWRRRRKAQA